jgi:hypothetical protein
MPRAKIAFDTVVEIGLKLPGTELGTAYGAPALKAGGRMFAVMATNKSAEPDSLCVCVDFETRDELIAEAPDIYYTASHYLTYPSVLVRLSRVHRDALPDLLALGHRFALSRIKKKSVRSQRRAPARPGARGPQSRQSPRPSRPRS